MDARWSRRWASGGLITSGGLDNGCQVVVFVNPSAGRGLPGGPDAYPGSDAGLES